MTILLFFFNFSFLLLYVCVNKLADSIILFLLSVEHLELRLREAPNSRNLSRLEVRRSNGEWGSICCRAFCGTDMNAPPRYVSLTMMDLCQLFGFQHFLSFSNNVEKSDDVSLPIHLELSGPIQLFPELSLDVGNWSEPTCDYSNNLFLSCISGMIIGSVFLFLDCLTHDDD